MDEKVRLFQTKEISCVVTSEGFIGEGSYGVVRLGFHDVYGAVAVKCSAMKGGRAEKKLIEKTIIREIGHLQKASHENVVRVYGWAHWSGSIAIVMEYLPAGSLKHALLDHDVDLSWHLRLRFCAEIANGIAFLHNISGRKRLVHGDIKPDNILLSSDLHCKIADFGGAALRSYTGLTTTVKPGTSTESDTKTDNNQYTELYAPPELLKNPHGKRIPQHDAYSFAITMHMILSREPPFALGTSMKVCLEGVKDRGTRPNPESINSQKESLKETDDIQLNILELLVKLMTSCWHQNPKERPTMTEVKRQLHNCLSKCHLPTIHQHVVNALKSMEVENPSRENYQCVPLDNFSPPNFEDVIGNDHSSSEEKIEPSTFLSQPSVSETEVDRTLTPSETDEHSYSHIYDTVTNNPSKADALPKIYEDLQSPPLNQRPETSSSTPQGGQNLDQSSSEGNYDHLHFYESIGPGSANGNDALPTSTHKLSHAKNVPKETPEPNEEDSYDWSRRLNQSTRYFEKSSRKERDDYYLTPLPLRRTASQMEIMPKKNSALKSFRKFFQPASKKKNPKKEHGHSPDIEPNRRLSSKNKIAVNDTWENVAYSEVEDAKPELSQNHPAELVGMKILSIQFRMANLKADQAVVREIEELLKVDPASVTGECEAVIDDVNDIISRGNLIEDDSLFKLINWCMDVCDNIPDRNKVLHNLQRCINVIHGVATSMSKHGLTEGLTKIFPLQQSAVDRIELVTAIDQKYKTDVQCWGLLYVACCYKFLDDKQEAIKTCKTAINKMIKEFGEESRLRRVVATCYHVMAQLTDNAEKKIKVYEEIVDLYQNVDNMEKLTIPLEGVYD